MLGKLIKYELKATARKITPLYIALLIFALIINLFIGSVGFNNDLVGLPMILGVFAYGCTMAAVFIITFFTIVQRFYKNLLGREGYLMNTLPVPTWMNISNKLIVSIIWSLVSGIVAFLSIIIMAFSEDTFSQLLNGFSDLIANLIQGHAAYILEWALYLFVSMIVSTLMLYLSMSLGHLFNKRRILLSFASYIILSIVISIIKNIANIGLYLPNMITIKPKIHGLLIFDILLAVVLFVGCNYIIKNKLNLE